MQLTDEDIREFQEVWRQEFKEEISEGKAREEASRLLELALLLATTPSRDQITPPCPSK